jgi:hypothetical protein
MTQPFPFGAVNRAIASEVGEGPTADALRALAQAAGGGGSGPGGVGYDAIFRPGTPSSGNAFATEAEVFAAIATIDFPRVGIDLTATPNPGVAFVVTQDWDLRGGSIFAIYPVTDTFKLQFNEPHQLLNTQSVQIGLGVHFNRSATPGIAYPLFPTSIPHILAVVGGAVVWSEGTFPVIDLIGETQAISLLTGAVRLTGGAAPFVRGDTTSAVIAVNLASSGSLGQSLDNNWVAGPVGMQLGYIADASFAAPTLAAFFGTFNGTTLIDRAGSVLYDDTLVPPVIGATNVQDAIDLLKGAISTLGPGIGFNAAAAYSPAAAGYLAYGSTPITTATDDQRYLAARSGIIDSMFVEFLGDPSNGPPPPGPAAQTATFEVQINGVTQGSVGPIVTDAGPKSGNSTGLAISYGAGDTIGVRHTMTGRLGAVPITNIRVGLGLHGRSRHHPFLVRIRQQHSAGARPPRARHPASETCWAEVQGADRQLR